MLGDKEVFGLLCKMFEIVKLLIVFLIVDLGLLFLDVDFMNFFKYIKRVIGVYCLGYKIGIVLFRDLFEEFCWLVVILILFFLIVFWDGVFVWKDEEDLLVGWGRIFGSIWDLIKGVRVCFVVCKVWNIWR